MTQISNKQIQKSTDEIKLRLLNRQPFSNLLERLYLDLSLQGKHTQLIEVYHLLSLYAEEKDHNKLFHSALIQAFLSTGQISQAAEIAHYLHQKDPENPEVKKLMQAVQIRQKTNLPVYTSLVSLSKHARKSNRNTLAHSRQLPAYWKETFDSVTAQKLQQIGYYTQLKKLQSIPRKYRHLVKSTFDEMVLNYLFNHNRSVVVLAGSLLEMLLSMYLFENLHIKYISVNSQKKSVFTLNLHEMIQICEQKQLLPATTLKLCHSARAQRNFIHPGKEISEKTSLSSSSRRICFLAVFETIDFLYKTRKSLSKK